MTDALPVGERPQLAPPVDETGPLGWARKHLFSSWLNGIVTIALIVAIGWVVSWFVNWAILTANFTAATGADCRGGGARILLSVQGHDGVGLADHGGVVRGADHRLAFLVSGGREQSRDRPGVVLVLPRGWLVDDQQAPRAGERPG